MTTCDTFWIHPLNSCWMACKILNRSLFLSMAYGHLKQVVEFFEFDLFFNVKVSSIQSCFCERLMKIWTTLRYRYWSIIFYRSLNHLFNLSMRCCSQIHWYFYWITFTNGNKKKASERVKKKNHVRPTDRPTNRSNEALWMSYHSFKISNRFIDFQLMLRFLCCFAVFSRPFLPTFWTAHTVIEKNTQTIYVIWSI